MAKLFVDKAVEINASPSEVWDALTKSELTAQWAPEFSSGGPKFHLESDWKLGSRVLWKDENNKVIVEGNVTALEPNKLLRFTVFDVRREERPTITEEDGITYQLTQEDGKTRLQVLQGDFSVMSDGEKYQRLSGQVWDRVLGKVKALAEQARGTDQQTCGRGLAENSKLPAKCAELFSAMAENLEVHMKALDLQDQNARKEYDAYEKLLWQQREIAVELQAMADEMAGYRDLPMGVHNEKAMLDVRVLQAFEKFVKIKQELLAIIQNAAKQDQKILMAMRKSSGGGTE
jgi:uncharacterized protein YndB with AHSA1/START domain